jgi:hypothetical protein
MFKQITWTLHQIQEVGMKCYPQRDDCLGKDPGEQDFISLVPSVVECLIIVIPLFIIFEVILVNVHISVKYVEKAFLQQVH